MYNNEIVKLRNEGPSVVYDSLYENNQIINYEVAENKVTLTIENEITPTMEMEVIKVDTEGNPIEGVQFSLYTPVLEKWITDVTDEHGIISFDLPLWSYMIEGDVWLSTWFELYENSVPEGYILGDRIEGYINSCNDEMDDCDAWGDNLVDFIIDPIEKKATLTVENESIPTIELELIKVDTEGNPVEGAEFSLYHVDFDEYITGVTDEHGIIVFNLPFETYEPGSPVLAGGFGLMSLGSMGCVDFILQETSVPRGYLLNDLPIGGRIRWDCGEIEDVWFDSEACTNVIDFVIDSSGEKAVLTVENEILYTTELEILKVDTKGNPIEGVEFGLYEGATDSYMTGITDENGKLIFNVPIGRFREEEDGVHSESQIVVQELEVPEGYILNNTPIRNVCVLSRWRNNICRLRSLRLRRNGLCIR